MGTTFTVTAPQPATWSLLLYGLGVLIVRMRLQPQRDRSRVRS